jgi:hypothetical protein
LSLLFFKSLRLITAQARPIAAARKEDNELNALTSAAATGNGPDAQAAAKATLDQHNRMVPLVNIFGNAPYKDIRCPGRG